MKYTICKSFKFDAAHRLPKVAADHPCGAMHGHTYRLELELTSKRLTDGMVLDYDVLASYVEPLVKRKRGLTAHPDCVDHTTLNSVKGLENPTTEVLAAWFVAKLGSVVPMLSAVRVYESDSTWCEVRL